MIYHSHGNFRLQWQDPVLSLTLEGGFNIEGVQKVSLECEKLTEIQDAHFWALLVVLDADTLLVWESLPHVRDFLTWCDEMGCSAIAYVVSSQIQLKVTNTIFEPLPLNFRCFKEEVSALRWLRENMTP